MNHEQELDRELKRYAESMTFQGQTRVLDHLLQGARQPEPARRTSGKRTAIALALCALLLTATVFAKEIGEVIRRITTAHIEAQQQTALISDYDNKPITTQIRVIGSGNSPTATGDITKAEYLQVDSIEEAQAMLDFEITPPSELPEGYALGYAELFRYETGYVSQSVDLHYQKAHYGFYNQIIVSLTHAGPDGKLGLSTVLDMTQTQVNGLDAVLTTEPNGGCELWWIQGEVAYHVAADDLETALKVAESIR